MASTGYDVWLWDLDGTLVDTEWGYIRERFDRVGDRLGTTFTDRDAAAIWHGYGGSRAATLRDRGLDPDRFWPAFHAVEDPQARAEATYLYDDAAAIADLDAPTGVVTHCQRFLTDPVLDHLGIRDWFDTVVCCSDDVGWKPDPAPVEAALAALDAEGAHGVLVGDAACDVGAAWNAGLAAAHVERRTPARRGYCVLGDHQVTDLDAIPGFNSD